MQIGETKLSALVVAGLTFVALTATLAPVVGLATALSVAVPAAGVMGIVLVVMASDIIKKRGDKPPKEKATEGE
jgi:hypothetical protein